MDDCQSFSSKPKRMERECQSLMCLMARGDIEIEMYCKQSSKTIQERSIDGVYRQLKTYFKVHRFFHKINDARPCTYSLP